MADIVERLRDWEDYEPVKMFGGEILKDTKEAAEEIERLRARLDLIAGIAEGSTTANSLPHIAKIARSNEQ